MHTCSNFFNFDQQVLGKQNAKFLYIQNFVSWGTQKSISVSIRKIQVLRKDWG